MIKRILAAGGLGLAGYVLFLTWKNDTGINSSDEGGFFDAGAGEILGGFLTVGSMIGSNLNMNISIVGLAHIKGWEALRLNRYLDEGGKPTIGYGHLIQPGEDLYKITEPEANGLLLMDLKFAIEAVNKAVKVPINQYQFDALVSFVFNVGASRFYKSTLLKLLNQGDIAGVRLQFGKWVYVGKSISAGLVNRRAGDLKLFNGVA